MLKKDRLERVNDELKKMNVSQMLISDPTSIFYLLDKWFYPGERFLALMIFANREPLLILNTLFRIEEDLGIEIIYYNDNESFIPLVKDVCEKTCLGVDKDLPARFLLPLMESDCAISYKNTSLAIDEVRGIKDEEEKELMRQSSLINDRAMARFKGLLKDDISEKEVAEQMLPIYQSLGAEAYSFEPIVAFGKNAADPHHMPDDTKLKIGDLVLLDVGCRYRNYCSDMTRCFFYKHEPSKAQKEIYRLVQKANEEATDKVRSGIPLKDIDYCARKIISDGGYGDDFTHRLGHFIGLNDHDYGDVSSANEAPVKEGNVFSIEPGIYSLKEGIGVRIEDLILVQDGKAEVLNHYPHEIEIIE